MRGRREVGLGFGDYNLGLEKNSFFSLWQNENEDDLQVTNTIGLGFDIYFVVGISFSIGFNLNTMYEKLKAIWR